MSPFAHFIVRTATTAILLGALTHPCVATAAIFNVTNGNNSGTGSLRAAIEAANADNSATVDNPHFIAFSGVGTVTLSATLPTIVQPTLINVSLFGSPNPAVTLRATSLVSGNALTFAPASAGSYVQSLIVRCTSPVPCFSGRGIQITGDAGLAPTTLDLVTVDGVGGTGIYIGSAQVHVDRSVVVRAGRNTSGIDRHGIECAGSFSRLTLTRSRIGLDADGNAAGNRFDGVHVKSGCLGSTIGGSITQGNWISANERDGVVFNNSGSSTQVRGNIIGLNIAGTQARANGRYGVLVHRSTGVTIGGTDEQHRNVISGNLVTNVRIDSNDGNQASATLQRNTIGPRGDGLPLTAGEMGNTAGISVLGRATATIGGTTHGNLIAYNGSHGITLGTITVTPGGSMPGRAQISRNSIHDNLGQGIADSTPPIPVPVITSLTGNSLIGGHVPAAPLGGTVEFFVDDWDQGRLYVGATTTESVSADGAMFATAINLGAHVGKRLTATHRMPASAGTLANWTGRFSAPQPIGNFILSVELGSAQSGERVESTPFNISCPGFCSAGYNSGSVVLNAFPNANRQVTWSDACSGSGNCTVTMTQPRNVIASFGPAQRSLAVSKVGQGTVISSPSGINCGSTCSTTFNHGTSVTLTATPTSNWAFSGWSGACTGSGTCTVSMTQARNVTATFTPIMRTLAVTINGQGSAVSNPAGIDCGSVCNGQFQQGTSVALNLTPAPGWRIASTSGCTLTGNTCSLVVSSDVTVTIGFAPLRSVNVTQVGQGTVVSTPSGIDCGNTCSAGFDDGAVVTLTATPAPNWAFSGWSGDCNGFSCTLIMNADRNVTATFVPVQRTLRVFFNGGQGTATSQPAGIDCVADCEANFDHGTVVQVNVVPAAGLQFSHWSGDCKGSGACSVTMDHERNVSANFIPAPITHVLTVTRSDHGTVTSNPTGIDCGAICSTSFAQDTVVVLMPTPAPGWQFSSWSGHCAGSGACSVTMSQAREVHASFTELPPQQFTLTVARTGQGTITSSPAGINCGAACSAAFADGTSVTLTPTPATGWQFSHWSGGCAGSGTCVVSMTQARDVTATFTELPLTTHLLTVTRDGQGSMSSDPAGIDCGATCSATFVQDTAVTLSATPAAGWQLSHWSGACAGSGICVVSMTQARTVTATFTQIPPQQFLLSVARVGQGNVTSSPAGIDCGATCSASFASGTQVTLTPIPATGWQFSHWSGECAGNGICTVNMLQTQSVTATFIELPPSNFALQVSKQGQGTAISTPAGIDCGDTCGAVFASGTSVTLTATPATGWVFGGWSGGCVGEEACVVTMSQNRNVTATFLPVHIFSAGFEP